MRESQRYVQVVRIIQMLDMMATPRGKSVVELAALFNCSKKTIYRMLNGLQAHNFPIWDEVRFDDYECVNVTYWKSRVKITYVSEENKTVLQLR